MHSRFVVSVSRRFPSHYDPQATSSSMFDFNLCVLLLLFLLHITQQNSQFGPNGISLHCLVLEDLEVTSGFATSMKLRCPSLQRLVLSNMPILETCSIECNLHRLDVKECPLLNVSSMIHPTLMSLTLINCIVSDITMAHSC